MYFKETWAEYVARLEPHERQELEFILRKRRRDFDENISLDPKNAMRNKPPNWVRLCVRIYVTDFIRNNLVISPSVRYQHFYVG